MHQLRQSSRKCALHIVTSKKKCITMSPYTGIAPPATYTPISPKHEDVNCKKSVQNLPGKLSVVTSAICEKVALVPSKAFGMWNNAIFFGGVFGNLPDVVVAMLCQIDTHYLYCCCHMTFILASFLGLKCLLPKQKTISIIADNVACRKVS